MTPEQMREETLQVLREAFPEIDEDLFPFLMDDGLEL